MPGKLSESGHWENRKRDGDADFMNVIFIGYGNNNMETARIVYFSGLKAFLQFATFQSFRQSWCLTTLICERRGTDDFETEGVLA
jgi:hypothetical protein